MGAYRFGLNKCCHNTANRHEKDRDRIVVVLIHRPEDQTGDLEDVKGVEDLVEVSN